MSSGKKQDQEILDAPKQKPNAGITSERRVAPGHRVVHVVVPEKNFNHAKAQAFLSGVSWASFIAETLKRCQPLGDRREDDKD